MVLKTDTGPTSVYVDLGLQFKPTLCSKTMMVPGHELSRCDQRCSLVASRSLSKAQKGCEWPLWVSERTPEVFKGHFQFSARTGIALPMVSEAQGGSGTRFWLCPEPLLNHNVHISLSACFRISRRSNLPASSFLQVLPKLIGYE